MRLAQAIESWRAKGLLPPLVSLGPQSGQYRYAFSGINRALTLSVTKGGASILALGLDGEYFDLLLECEVETQRTSTGVRCAICAREGEHVEFASEEALFEDHVLQPLREWIDDHLVRATHLRLWQEAGCTWADLGEDVDPGARTLVRAIPLRG
jgi:hypothetical protein